jgi:membrane protease YdiL (CAAX protease family)
MNASVTDLSGRTRWQRVVAALRIGRVDPQQQSLFEFRRIWIVAPWAQVMLVVALFVTTVFATNAEFRLKGSVFGYAGPGFNALVCPIYEELIFRGWILAMLVRRHPNWFAIAVSSLLFGILHLRNIYWLETSRLAGNVACAGLAIGPVLGYVALRCRSVWPAVILHYLNNLTYYLRIDL